MSFEIIEKILTIIALDLVLSGDNAVVIAMASRRLPPEQRKRAIVIGGGGAVILRIAFTVAAALLLDVPLLQAIGGALLIFIALKLVRSDGGPQDAVADVETIGAAIRTIILADAVMSLDNMLAVGGAAHGHLGLLIFGLALSIPILLVGSSVIVGLIDRFPWLNFVGAAILVHTAMEMIFRDRYVHDVIHIGRLIELGIIVVLILGVVALGHWWNRRETKARLKRNLRECNGTFTPSEPR